MQTHRGLVEYQSARSVFSRTAQGEVNVYTTPDLLAKFTGAPCAGDASGGGSVHIYVSHTPPWGQRCVEVTMSGNWPMFSLRKSHDCFHTRQKTRQTTLPRNWNNPCSDPASAPCSGDDRSVARPSEHPAELRRAFGSTELVQCPGSEFNRTDSWSSAGSIPVRHTFGFAGSEREP